MSLDINSKETMEKENRYSFFIGDLIEHKKYVLECSKILAMKLHAEGREAEAKILLKRAFCHDDSKIDEDEMESFLELKVKNKCFKNANSCLNDYEKQRIAVHWNKNRHHPEFFSDVQDMTDMDIMEMVCDWAARSKQYGTDLVDFAVTRQANRFHFPEEMFEKILELCTYMAEYMT